ncbi:efflux RND transporter periplasmic adaptor subunit [Aquincola sp. S2]|uniref:Efflux RND transporter periplasmic adaptor subunit n=1 Tax=Pseudaquabacterium terrae TaxID=2732868 RepID=A0ABX2EMX6_9BURK|nr:efflux RND transporter periplasmic adaptor subunit [Aquabacterium terrae]NRF69929.1 efflux RND transporter periplasmic adaptor subunit [Aquabacterium terrae]
MKKVHTTVVVVALAGAAVGAWWLQNRPAASATPATAGAAAPAGGARAPAGPGGSAGPAAVEVGRAQTTRLEEDAQAVGTLRSIQGVMLRPEVGGRVQKLGFTDGQRVRRGQVMVQLDDALQQAQAQQAAAQASIARTNLQRNRELVAQNFVSQSVVDQAQANLEVAEAQVALAQAQLQRMKVLAPFDGIVGIRNVSIGDYVKDGADLVQVEDLSTVWVDFRLSERYLAQLKPGQAVAVNLDALPTRSYAARVEAVDSQLDASGRSLLVRARLANPGGELRSGMFARTRIVFGVRDQAVTVPEEALVPMGEQQFLVKVVDGPNGAKLSQRIVARIGARAAGRVEVLDGVAAGDLVVVAGQARLMRGEPQPLRIVQLGAGPAPAAASGASAPPAARRSANGASTPRVAFTTP